MIIDVHTHMYTPAWLELLKAKGGAYNIQRRPDGQDEIFRGDTPVAIPQPGHFDYALRIQQMDAAGIDISIVSLTCPNVYWGDEATSCQAAVESNDAMARALLAKGNPVIEGALSLREAQGRAEGQAEGKAEGKASAVLAVLDARGVPVDAEARARIAATRDEAVLDRWLARAGLVEDAAEL